MSDKSQAEHKYDMTSRWVREKIVTLEIEGKRDFHVATPPDFWPESPKELLSPEDLFVATATLAKGEFGWEFDQITINAKIIVATEQDKKRMEKAAVRTHSFCLVTNSMKCPTHLNYEVILEE